MRGGSGGEADGAQNDGAGKGDMEFGGSELAAALCAGTCVGGGARRQGEVTMGPGEKDDAIPASNYRLRQPRACVRNTIASRQWAARATTASLETGAGLR